MTSSEAPRRRPVLLLAALAVAVVTHWAFFFGLPPRVPREAADWPKEIRYYTVLQQAVDGGRIPYYVSRPIQETRKLLALPELVVSPQIVLLRWMSIDTFLLVHVVLLHAATVAACLALRRRYELSGVVFAMLFALLGFNGHITAHLAAGHSMWGGYFLLPALFALVLERDLEARGRWPIAVGLVLGAMLLQGSYHVFVWSLMLLALLLPLGPGRPAILAALAWSGALGLVRLLPPAMVLLDRRDAAFQTGYPGPAAMLAGLAVVRDATFPRLGAGSMGGLRWWEFDAYVGPVAVLWLAVFGLRALWRRADRASLGLAMGVMTACSFTAGFAWLSETGLPLLATQRVSSRFFIVPLGLLTVMAAVESERWRRAGSRWRTVVLTVVAAATIAALAGHSAAWRLSRVEAAFPPPPHPRDLAIEIAPIETGGARDHLYVTSVRVGAALSAAALMAAVWRWRAISRRSSR